MSSGCRATNALDISVQFARYTGIYVFWNAPPAAGSEHRLSQTVHCRAPGMTIAGFFRFVFITAFTSFLQDLCFVSYDGLGLGFTLFQKAYSSPLSFSPRRCDGKTPPPKTSSQSSQPSRGGVSTTDRSVICLLFLLKLVCTFWTAALHLRQQMGSGRSFLFLCGSSNSSFVVYGCLNDLKRRSPP